jgi:hypothetical protein
MDFLTKAIFNLKPNSQFSYFDNDYSTIKWDILDGEPPTKKQIDDEIKKIKATEISEAQLKVTAKSALLDKLGITAEEAQLLLS